MNKIPRRCRIDQMVPAELAIRNAMLEVEKMGADVQLTDAVNLLSSAQEKVADFVDDGGKSWCEHIIRSRLGYWILGLPGYNADAGEWNLCPICGAKKPGLPSTAPDTKETCGTCLCGHSARSHIYEEGACRPGFVCPCNKFNAKVADRG